MKRKMKLNKKRKITCEYFMYFMIFLLGLNFKNKYYYWGMIGFVVSMLWKKGKLILNQSTCSLFFLGISIMLFSENSFDRLTNFIKPFIYVACYIVGYNLLRGCLTNNEKEQKFEQLVVTLASANFLHLLLNWSINLNSSSRNTVDFWTGNVLSSTGQMALACLVIGSASAYLTGKDNWRYRIISASTLLAVLGYNLILAGRTIIVMLLLALSISYIYSLFSGLNTKDKLHKIIKLFLIILIIGVAYRFNFFNIKTIFEKSNLYYRFYGNFAQKMGSDSRMGYKMQYLSYMIYFPFGGNHILNFTGKYAHDLYLDTYDEAGIFALIAVMFYIIKTSFNLVNVQKSKTLNLQVKKMVLCIYIVMYIEFMLEPILVGVPWVFANFCCVDGGVSMLIRKEEKG